MSLETTLDTNKDILIWESRARKEQSTIGASIMRGSISVEESRRVQRAATKRLSSEGFDLNWAVDYYHKTGGLVYKDGELAVGEPVNSIWERKAEMIKQDRAREAQSDRN